MALTFRGLDVAALTPETFATPAEADAFTLGVLHGLDLCNDMLRSDLSVEDLRARLAERLARHTGEAG